MEKLYSYYKENISSYNLKVDYLKKQIHLLGSIRLAIVIALGVTIWFCRNESWQVWILLFVLFAIPFAALMLYHNRLSKKRDYAEATVRLNEKELKALDYDFSAFDGAPEKSQADHSFSLDLDLFGDRSIFQSLNRSATLQGKEILTEWFLNPLSNKEAILKRQEAIRELSGHTSFRQDFYVTGTRKTGNKKDSFYLDALTKEESYFRKSVFWKSLLWVIPVLWLILLTGFAFNLINGSILGIYFGICFVLANWTGRKINQIYQSVNKMERIFTIYSDLMKRVEESPFESEELEAIVRELKGHDRLTASQAIKQLSGYIGGLDQRYSAAGIILNILYLRDTRHAFHMERWKEEHRENAPRWIDALAHFDAYCSLGGFAFNHPEYIYPEIADSYFKMEGKGLGHPLLHRDVCVRNDIDIKKSPWFLVITGANMAGKSTYLRTIGVNYILSCIGAPVFADSLTVYPAHLITSLRTSDSLVSNESYFFAELKRLKTIIDRLKAGEELFIILDEILKGTNSIDKQKGSLALMKQLVQLNTCGIIATHDLVLGTLEEEFPNEIKNYRFEADIKENELSFTYTLREGIAQNMNAYFLMKKMGITV